jgi:hypothetical protein
VIRGNSEHLHHADGCTNLDDESEPYVYAGIDASYLPGSTKYVQTGIGEVDGVVTTEIKFPANDNVLYWAKVPAAKDNKVEVYIYGQDNLNRDDKLGTINLKLAKIKADCIGVPLLDQNVDSDLFSRDATCDFSVAVCLPGILPKDPDGTAWAKPGSKGSYTKGF